MKQQELQDKSKNGCYYIKADKEGNIIEIKSCESGSIKTNTLDIIKTQKKKGV